MTTRSTRDEGFTLVEILIAIVVVGILSAVVVVGISSLTSKGNTTACTASKDAAVAAATVHYANTGSYPSKLSDMTGATPPELSLPSNVTVATGGLATTGATWTLTISGGGSTTAPTFVCS